MSWPCCGLACVPDRFDRAHRESGSIDRDEAGAVQPGFSPTYAVTGRLNGILFLCVDYRGSGSTIRVKNL